MNAMSPPPQRTQAEEREFDAALIAATPKLRRAALVWTRDPDKAADLVQDTLVKALRARASFMLGTNMGAWLCFIGRNQFYSEKRRAWRMVQMPMLAGKDGGEISLAEQIPVAASQQDHIDLEELQEALSYLPSEMAEAIRCIAIDGLTYEEAANELDTETGTIKSRVSRGRKILDDYFGLNRRDA